MSGAQVLGTFPGIKHWDTAQVQEMTFRREVARRLADFLVGRVNWVLVFTLATGVTTTVVPADTITPNCEVSLDPLTPEAAALMGKVWATAANRVPGSPSDPTQIGQLTLNHPVILGGVVATYRASVKG